MRLVPLASLLREGSQESGGNAAGTPGYAQGQTDFGGEYVIAAVAPGSYIVDVQAAGYLDELQYVQLALKGLPEAAKRKLLATLPEVMVRAAGVASADVVVRRAGTISGEVTVDTGGTVGPIFVRATMVSSPLGGEVAEGSGAPEVQRGGVADDRGRYRIAGLPPGKYRVSVTLSEAYLDLFPGEGKSLTVKARRAGTAHREVYAPGTVKPVSARLVELRPGDETSGVDIVVPLGRLHSVGGSVLLNGNPMASAMVTMTPEGGPVDPFNAITDEAGRFRFDLIPNGTYALAAKERSGEGMPEQGKGNVTITVSDADATGVVLQLPASGK